MDLILFDYQNKNKHYKHKHINLVINYVNFLIIQNTKNLKKTKIYKKFKHKKKKN